MLRWKRGLTVAVLALAGGGVAFASSGKLTTWFFDPVTPISESVRNDFWYTMALIMPFMFLAHGLLIYSIIKFRAKPGRQPAKFHENLPLEIAWTALPTLTLILIAIPAYQLLRRMEVPPKSDLVVEIVGHQFFWEYKYPKYGFGYADQPLVVPENATVTLNGTSVDVIHSWFVPSVGVKFDVVPGKLTHSWFKVTQAGTYKGQCSQLCGKLHATMYIDLKVLPQDQYDEWVQQKITEMKMASTISIPKSDSTTTQQPTTTPTKKAGA